MTWIRYILRTWVAWLLACLGLLGTMFVRPRPPTLADRFVVQAKEGPRPWPEWLWSGPYDTLKTVVHWALSYPPPANIRVRLAPYGVAMSAAFVITDKDDAGTRPFRVGPRPTDYRPTAYRCTKWRPGALFPSFAWARRLTWGL